MIFKKIKLAKMETQKTVKKTMKNHNEPINPTGHSESRTGVTKREYFAAMAMQGLIAQASASEESRNIYTVNGGFVHPKTIANEALAIADALIDAMDSKLQFAEPKTTKELAYHHYVNECGSETPASFEIWEKHYDDGTEYLLDEEKALRNGNREPNYERPGH